MDNKNAPAFGYGFTTADGNSHVNESGLTKREYFAAMAMQGLCTNPRTEYTPMNEFAELAVKYADALLTELSKEVTNG